MKPRQRGKGQLQEGQACRTLVRHPHPPCPPPRRTIGLLRLFTSCIPLRSTARRTPSAAEKDEKALARDMNGAPPTTRQARPPPTGPTPPAPAPAAAPPAAPHAAGAQPGAAQPPPASRPPNGPVNGAHSHNQKGKKKNDPPVDPSQLYESLKNRIATLEEEEIHNEEEERKIGEFIAVRAP